MLGNYLSYFFKHGLTCDLSAQSQVQINSPVHKTLNSQVHISSELSSSYQLSLFFLCNWFNIGFGNKVVHQGHAPKLMMFVILMTCRLDKLLHWKENFDINWQYIVIVRGKTWLLICSQMPITNTILSLIKVSEGSWYKNFSVRIFV